MKGVYPQSLAQKVELPHKRLPQESQCLNVVAESPRRQAGPVRRQREEARTAVQSFEPIGQRRFPSVTLQPFVLPSRVVGVLDRRCLPGGETFFNKGSIMGTEFLNQNVA